MSAYATRDRPNTGKSHATDTQAGLIPHLWLTSRCRTLRIEAPVALLPPRQGEDRPRPKLARDTVGYVYALPGGREWEG